MKRSLLFSLALLLFIASCTSSKKIATSNAQTGKGQSISENERDGSSFEKAIIINAKSDMAGVTEEYDWLKKKLSRIQNPKAGFDELQQKALR